jgi:hypothetical protein
MTVEIAKNKITLQLSSVTAKNPAVYYCLGDIARGFGLNPDTNLPAGDSHGLQKVLKTHPALGLSTEAGAGWNGQGLLLGSVVFLLLQSLTCLKGHLSLSLSLSLCSLTSSLLPKRRK